MTSQSQNIDPNQADPRVFRDALGQFGTGVTVVTCHTQAGPMGITANSFSSLSLDPPLVLWSPAKASGRYDAFYNAQYFAIHILAADQAEICMRFARSGQFPEGLAWSEGEGGTPLIDGCLSRFECQKFAAHDAGDHTIIIGHVTRLCRNSGAPLLFHSGKYGRFHPHDKYSNNSKL